MIFFCLLFSVFLKDESCTKRCSKPCDHHVSSPHRDVCPTKCTSIFSCRFSMHCFCLFFFILVFPLLLPNVVSSLNFPFFPFHFPPLFFVPAHLSLLFFPSSNTSTLSPSFPLQFRPFPLTLLRFFLPFNSFVAHFFSLCANIFRSLFVFFWSSGLCFYFCFLFLSPLHLFFHLSSQSSSHLCPPFSLLKKFAACTCVEKSLFLVRKLFRPPGASHQAGSSWPFWVVLQVGFSLVSWHCTSHNRNWTSQQERMPLMSFAPSTQTQKRQKNKTKNDTNKSIGPRQGGGWAQTPNQFKPKPLPSTPSFLHFFPFFFFFRVFSECCVYFPTISRFAQNGEKKNKRTSMPGRAYRKCGGWTAPFLL